MSLLPPDPDDLDNVRALNLRYLELVADGDLSLQCALPLDLAGAIRAFDAQQRARLAASPFLLFVTGVDTDGERSRAVGRSADLFDPIPRPASPSARLHAAALGFLWELARRRPYAARVLSGLSADRCAMIAESTPVALFTEARVGADALALRAGDDAVFWRRLVAAAQSDDPSVAEAARIAALQTALARTAAGVQLPAAACSMRSASRKVADRRPVSDDGVRGYNTPPDGRAANKKP